MRKRIKKVLVWAPAVVWMGVIYFFSGRTEPVSGEIRLRLGDWTDSLFHALEYAVLSLFVYFGFLEGKPFERTISQKCFLYSAALAVTFALSDEVHQIVVPGRGFQVKDLLFDTLGAGIGLLGVRMLVRLGWRVGGREKS